MSYQKPSLRLEIDTFSRQDDILSYTFLSGECEWNIDVYTKGDYPGDGHLSLCLELIDSSMLPTGVERSFNFYFVLLNQFHKVLFRSKTGQARNLFHGWSPLGWEYKKTIPVSKFQEKGFLESDKLIIEVYIQVVEDFDGEGGDVSDKKKKKKTVDINGFQVIPSQVTKLRKIFTEHPDIAKDFKPVRQAVKTAYMKVLLRVIKTIHKPPKNLSETRLRKASSELRELTMVGFKVDWLKLKLEEVSLERKKADVDGSQIQQVEKRVKDLELVKLGVKLDKVALEKKKAYDTNDSRAKQVEKRVKNLERMELSLKFDSLNTKLDKVALERKKADDTNESRAKKVEKRVKNLELKDLAFNRCLKPKLDELESKKSRDAIFFEQLEDRVMGIEFKLDSLNTKLEEISNERKKADDADGSLVQQLEESVKNIELMVSHLKAEVDNKKNKSSADDGFLLVD